MSVSHKRPPLNVHSRLSTRDPHIGSCGNKWEFPVIKNTSAIDISVNLSATRQRSVARARLSHCMIACTDKKITSSYLGRRKTSHAKI